MMAFSNTIIVEPTASSTSSTCYHGPVIRATEEVVNTNSPTRCSTDCLSAGRELVLMSTATPTTVFAFQDVPKFVSVVRSAVSTEASSTSMDAQVVFEGMTPRYITNLAPGLLTGVVLLGSVTKVPEFQKVLESMTSPSRVMSDLPHIHVFDKEQWPPPLLDYNTLLTETIQLCFSLWPLVNCDWASVQHRPPWPPLVPCELQVDGVQLRPVPWPSFGCHAALRLESLWLPMFSSSESKDRMSLIFLWKLSWLCLMCINMNSGYFSCIISNWQPVVASVILWPRITKLMLSDILYNNDNGKILGEVQILATTIPWHIFIGSPIHHSVKCSCLIQLNICCPVPALFCCIGDGLTATTSLQLRSLCSSSGASGLIFCGLDLYIKLVVSHHTLQSILVINAHTTWMTSCTVENITKLEIFISGTCQALAFRWSSGLELSLQFIVSQTTWHGILVINALRFHMIWLENFKQNIHKPSSNWLQSSHGDAFEVDTSISIVPWIVITILHITSVRRTMLLVVVKWFLPIHLGCRTKVHLVSHCHLFTYSAHDHWPFRWLLALLIVPNHLECKLRKLTAILLGIVPVILVGVSGISGCGSAAVLLANLVDLHQALICSSFQFSWSTHGQLDPRMSILFTSELSCSYILLPEVPRVAFIHTQDDTDGSKDMPDLLLQLDMHCNNSNMVSNFSGQNEGYSTQYATPWFPLIKFNQYANESSGIIGGVTCYFSYFYTLLIEDP